MMLSITVAGGTGSSALGVERLDPRGYSLSMVCMDDGCLDSLSQHSAALGRAVRQQGGSVRSGC